MHHVKKIIWTRTGERVKRRKKKRGSCQEDNLDVKTEPVKLQKLEKTESPTT